MVDQGNDDNEQSDDGFSDIRVAAFESRRAEEMSRMIERLGGHPSVSPSMQEVAVEVQPDVVEFAQRLITGQVEVVILLTGVGFEFLLAAIEKKVDRQRFLDSLGDITTVVRGPKPAAAMRAVGLSPTHIVPEPNTWREILATVDEHLSVCNQSIGLQEYGQPNPSLIAGLEARGALVTPLRVYRWGMPADTTALDANLNAIVNGERDVTMFTSAHQVTNVLARAAQLGLGEKIKASLRDTVICSVGPSTSEMLRNVDLAVDFEPSRPKLGPLVSESASNAVRLKKRKRQIHASLSGPQTAVNDQSAPWYDSPFMRACRLEENDVTPIWLMRQAGRYLPEYREIRSKTSFIELCKNPSLCAEVMVNTVNRLGVDAAIIFSDILPILEPMGLELEYVVGDGPKIHNPVREPGEIDRVLALESVDSLDFVMETVRQTRNELAADIPVIGFSGAPFTLASYVIEGGSSRNYVNTKTLMYRDAGAWHELMTRFARSISLYLNAQVAAGAQCLQLFDSWAGCLSVADYREFVLPHVQSILATIPREVPVINFATGNPALLPCLSAVNPQVVGIDWRVDINEAWQTVGHHRAVQGNLDPLVLFADRQTVVDRANRILKAVDGRPGHIFNLGHGVLPNTPVDNVLALVDAVHEFRAK